MADWITETMGQWWLEEAMFSLRLGMHSFFQKPSKAEMQAAGIPDTFTSFHEQLIIMAKHYPNIKVDFMLGTKIEKIVKQGAASMEGLRRERENSL